MLRRDAASDRVLAVTSVCLSIAACAALALAVVLPLVGFFFRTGDVAFVFVTIGGVLVASAPGLALAGVVCAHISRRMHPDVGLNRIALILGYSVLGVLAFAALAAVVTWYTINTR